MTLQEFEELCSKVSFGETPKRCGTNHEPPWGGGKGEEPHKTNKPPAKGLGPQNQADQWGSSAQRGQRVKVGTKSRPNIDSFGASADTLVTRHGVAIPKINAGGRSFEGYYFNALFLACGTVDMFFFFFILNGIFFQNDAVA